jgi:hypothetical protein
MLPQFCSVVGLWDLLRHSLLIEYVLLQDKIKAASHALGIPEPLYSRGTSMTADHHGEFKLKGEQSGRENHSQPERSSLMEPEIPCQSVTDKSRTQGQQEPSQGWSAQAATSLFDECKGLLRAYEARLRAYESERTRAFEDVIEGKEAIIEHLTAENAHLRAALQQSSKQISDLTQALQCLHSSLATGKFTTQERLTAPAFGGAIEVQSSCWNGSVAAQSKTPNGLSSGSAAGLSLSNLNALQMLWAGAHREHSSSDLPGHHYSAGSNRDMNVQSWREAVYLQSWSSSNVGVRRERRRYFPARSQPVNAAVAEAAALTTGRFDREEDCMRPSSRGSDNPPTHATILEG